MIRSFVFALGLVLVWGLTPVTALRAQEATAEEMRVWLQVEANSTLEASLERARDYAARLGNVSGFQLPSGWHAIVLGPFENREDANEVRRQLQSEGVIPRDSFATEGRSYGPQFFPEDAAEFREPPAPDPVAEDEGTVGATAPEAPVAPAEGIAEEPSPDIAAADPADAVTEEPAAEEPVIEEPVIEEPVISEPVIEEPVIEEEPEETLREAQASERLLNRDERAALQVALQWFGFYTMSIDAAFGPGTRRAMTAWQEDRDFEPTGVLTTSQREQLIREYSAELAALGMEEWRDERAGIAIELPLEMIVFDRYEAPFAHFMPRDDSGVRVLLISQSGTQATLFGLYEIMQTLEIVPLEGERRRQANSFVLTGQSETLRSHSFAQYRNGQIKGYTLVWTPERDEQMARVLPMMEASFTTFGNTLPDGIGEASAVQRRDLLAGLSVRRPERSRSGFYVDATGTVLTSSEAVAGCARVTIDEAYNARVIATDTALGVAALEPETPLVPLAFAQFATSEQRLASEIWVAGFGFEDLLTRPLLTAGSLEDIGGLAGEPELVRLGVEVSPGDSGGPVFNGNGAVIGLLLPAADTGNRLLPPGVSFAANADALRDFLSANGIRSGTQSEAAAMPPGLLTRAAGDLTVLVSCWN